MVTPQHSLRLVEHIEALDADGDLDRIFRLHAGYVASVAFRLMGRHADVDDIVQEVFVAAMRGLRNLRDPAAIRGWLATVAVRVTRRRLRRRRLASLFGGDARSDYDALVVEAPQDQAMLIKRAYRILDALPVDARIAWMLRHVEGEALDDVARLCSCSLATAKRRIAVAQAALDDEVRE